MATLLVCVATWLGCVHVARLRGFMARLCDYEARLCARGQVLWLRRGHVVKLCDYSARTQG